MADQKRSMLIAPYYGMALVHCAINSRLVRSPSRISVPLVHVSAQPVENLRCRVLSCSISIA